MMDRTIWFCALAISLAVISVSMVPPHKSVATTAPVVISQLTPVHSLTGISFHSVGPGY